MNALNEGGQPAATATPRRGAPWILCIVLLALAGWLAFEAYWPKQRGDALSTALTAIEKQNRLTVFSAQLAPVVAANDSRMIGLLNSRQVAIIPAQVDYSVDLSQVNRSRLSWSEGAQILSIRLPPIEPGTPNLDEARAQYLREGIWITSDAQATMSRKNTQLATQQAIEQARRPVLLRLAESAAQDAISQNLSIPLKMAGFANTTVKVSFDGT